MIDPVPDHRRPAAEHGSFLVAGLLISLVVMLFLASAIVVTTAMGKSSQISLNQTEAFALSEGVTEIVQNDMITKRANFDDFELAGTVTLGTTDHSYEIDKIGDPVTRTDSDGVYQSVQSYEIVSTVSVGNTRATARRVVDVAMTPIFQYMILYDGDLEILPGAAMTLGGRIHSNGSIYMGTYVGTTVKVDTDYLRCAGEVFYCRKDTLAPMPGPFQVKVFEEPTFKPTTPGSDSSCPTWVQLANDTWKGTVQTGAHGMKKVAVPEIGSIKAFDPDGEKGYYHASAGLVIRNTTAYDPAGNIVTLPAGTITEKTLYDAREEKTITLTEVDVGLLNTSACFPGNGLLYAYRTDASSSQPNGIRLTNGATLRSSLTVVSEDPVFVKGDYNSTDKKGAAVISDAVNLLSNAWNDTKVKGTVPAATETTFNMAIITGNVQTPTKGGGNYSGGFENLPRFHERWTNVNVNIKGAFINIFQSEIGKSPWGKANVYQPPVRVWSFDKDLLNMNFIPPFTPNAVAIRRLLWDDGIPSPLAGG